jgi:hypothetical protein
MIELAGSSRLKAGGLIAKDAFRAGDPISIEGYASKTQEVPRGEATLFLTACTTLSNVVRRGHAREVTLADGRQVRFDDANFTATIVKN